MLREGYFLDERSFVSLPDGEDSESHVFLKGKDWERQKQRVFDRDHEQCVICRRGYARMDVHHVIRKSQGGSVDMGNLETRCAEHHNSAHPEKRTRFGEYKGATPLPVLEAPEGDQSERSAQ